VIALGIIAGSIPGDITMERSTRKLTAVTVLRHGAYGFFCRTKERDVFLLYSEVEPGRERLDAGATLDLVVTERYARLLNLEE
jgi:cold shock CspA family protein